MKFTLLSLATTMATLTTALPTTTTTTTTTSTITAADLAPRDNWLQYVQDWPESGLQRWRYDYRGYSSENWGQDFLAAIRRHGGTANNWQAYDIGNGIWQFDVSETQTWFGTQAIINGVQDVTGLSCYEQGVNSQICRDNGFLV